MTRTEYAFEIKGLSKHYGHTRALDLKLDRPLHIYRGETTVILGLSGSGKSTFLNLMALLEDADAGVEVTYRSPDEPRPISYSALNAKEKTAFRNKELGFAFQDGHLLSHVSVCDNIELPLALAGAKKSALEHVSSVLTDDLKLDHRRDARPKVLSGGEHQRTAIARALAHNPNVIFADEPTGNLDTDTGHLVMELLQAWRGRSPDNTLVLVTHDLRQACDYADYFIILENGSLKCEFTREDLFSPEGAPWKEKNQISADETGIDALLKLMRPPAAETEEVRFPVWKKETLLINRIAHLFRYSFRDLFPLKLWPFDKVVYKSSFRDTLFSLLTIASVTALITVLLLGLGIFNGVSRFQACVTKGDMRANRLILEVGMASMVDEIDEALIGELRETLTAIPRKPGFFSHFIPFLPKKDPPPAIAGVWGYSNAQLFIYTEDGKTVGAIGTTVDPDSLLLKRLTSNGEPLGVNPIIDGETEGLVVRRAWYERNFPERDSESHGTVFIRYGRETGGSTKEPLPILAIVDDLPDGVFLIAPGCWHKIRDRTWRPNYTFIKVTGLTEAECGGLSTEVGKRMASFFPSARTSVHQTPNGPAFYLNSGVSGGWRKQFWLDRIIPTHVNAVMQEKNIKGNVELAGPTVGDTALNSKLSYLNAAVYLEDISAIEDVSTVVSMHPSKLGMDSYVENAYKWVHQTKMLSSLIFGVFAVCAFFFCGINIFLMFYQTVLRKRHEIGILKAFGCTRLKIASIFVIESGYMAAIATVLGTLLAQYLGNRMGNTLMGIYDLGGPCADLFLIPQAHALGIVAFVFSLCISITYLATRGAASKTANELLRQKN